MPISKLVVVERETQKEVHSIDVSKHSERRVEKILAGLLRNMDTERFTVLYEHEPRKEEQCK